MKVLALFPPLHDDNPGGIQVSGRLAWEALERSTDAALLEVSARHRLRAIRAAREQPSNCDVVLFWHLDLLRLAPFLPRHARRVVFLHGIEAWRRPDFMTRTLLRRATLLANSQYTTQRAEPHLAAPIADVVHLGLGEPASLVAAPLEPPAALMIARLDAGERYKGHHEVIGAWPLVQQRIPGAQLWIAGAGSLQADLEAEAHALQLGDTVRFFGRVSEAEKHDLLRAARCLVLPSRGEGFGLVYLEAMRAGRPCVVGTDAGREVVNPPEAGLAVEPADTQALARAIVQLLTPGVAWERMSEAARARHAELFTACHFQARLLTALEGLR